MRNDIIMTFKKFVQYRSWAKCFFWRGGGDLAEWNLGGVREKKTLKIFEIFIPEIASNASNFKN